MAADLGIPKKKVAYYYHDEIGNFYYGGSLNILLFSKGLASPAVQVRMGNQIAILNAGKTPKVK